jgi:hypothetical protein
MTSSSRPSCQPDQNDPVAAQDVTQREAGAIPTVPVVRFHTLNISFIAARVRLVSLISGGSLVPASIDAYARGLPKLARRAPGDPLSAAALITVRIPEPADAAGLVVLPLHWHAMGAGGQLIRVLNADLMLIAARADRTLLRLQGAFRLPFAVAGPEPDRHELPQRAAAASMSFLLDHVRAALAGPAPGPGLGLGLGAT